MVQEPFSDPFPEMWHIFSIFVFPPPWNIKKIITKKFAGQILRGEGVPFTKFLGGSR